MYFGKNIRYLRKLKALNQDAMQTGTGIARATWSDYERGNTQPTFEVLSTISDFFNVSIDTLLKIDLEKGGTNVHLNETDGIQKISENVHPKVHPSVHLNKNYVNNSGNITLTVVTDDDPKYGGKSATIPITDISVAAGSGSFNSEYIEKVDSLRLPGALVKTGSTYLCVRIKGVSMSPTLQDGGFVIIRLLDRSEWAKMPDERIFVVVNTNGEAFLKRVKNRFKQNFIVLKSDSPDQASFPNFNLATNEIAGIWYVEWYLSAKMPNIHDQYYSRLQKLEDRLDDITNSIVKVNR